MTDPWIRFDMWAQRAHEAAQAAIETERARGNDERETCSVTDSYNRAADVYRDIATSCRPDVPAEPERTPMMAETEAP